jgi:hypothetical protein
VLKTYRVEEALVRAVAVRARARGETVTDVIERAFHVYIQGDSPAQAVYTPPAPSLDPVAALRARMEDHGVPLTVASEMEAAPEPEKRPCRHPSALIQDDGTCGECGNEVDLP